MKAIHRFKEEKYMLDLNEIRNNIANVNSSNKRGRILNFLIVLYRFWSSYLYIYLSVIFSYSMAARINDPTDFGSFSITGSLI